MIYLSDLDPKLFTLLTLKTIAARYTTPIDLPDNALCLFCRRPADNELFNVYKKHEIVSILQVLSIHYEEIPDLVDYICYVCVFRFSIIIDYRRLINNTYIKSRANYFFNIGDREKCINYLSKQNSTTSRTDNQNSNNIATASSSSSSTTTASASNSRIVNGFLNHNHENNDEIINGISSNFYYRDEQINDEENNFAQQDFLFYCLQHAQNIIPGRLSDKLKEINITFTKTPRDTTIQTETISVTLPQSQQSLNTTSNTVPLSYATTSQQQQQQQQTTMVTPTTSSSIDISMKNLSPPSPQGLEILYEGSPHSVLVTESGHANEQYDENILKPYECEMCLKRFSRSRLLRKHQRQHYNNNNIDDGNNSLQQQKRGRKRKRRYSGTTKSLLATTSYRTIIHYCNICNITFENLKLFKKHNREIHENIHKCSYCTDSFCCRSDWELHEAICYGKKLAEIDNNIENINGKNEVRIYQTRSRRSTIISNKNNKRTIDYNESNKDSDEEEIEEIDSLYNEKVRSVNDWIENQVIVQTKREKRLNKFDIKKNYKYQRSSLSNFPQSDTSSISRDSSLSRASSVSRNFPGLSRESSLSRASTLSPSSRDSSLTRSSIPDLDVSRTNIHTPRSSRRGRIKRINADSENQKEVYTSLDQPEFGIPVIISTPELVHSKQLQLFHCPENGCDFVHHSLNRLMHHDIECHNQLPLFYCKICKFRFIRRFYYEQHIMFQCYGWYFCFKCEKRFDYLYLLKEHLNLHKITIPHKCTICNLSFLTQNNLEEHLLSEKHKKTVINKPPRIIFERYDYHTKNNELNNKDNENENEEQQQQEKLQQIQENQNNEEDLNQQQQINEENEENSQDDVQNNENDEQQIQKRQENENQNNENQLQITTKQQQGIKRPLPSSSSSSPSSYRSIIKILKLMDTERSNDREVLTWYPGIVFELSDQNVQNCALPSSYPRRRLLNQN